MDRNQVISMLTDVIEETKTAARKRIMPHTEAEDHRLYEQGKGSGELIKNKALPTHWFS
jgi:hypothetical protein